MPKPIDQALAVAIAEARSLRRMPRTWLLSGLAVSSGLTAYYVLAELHAEHSYLSSTAGFANPRFLIGFFGVAPLWIILIGVAILAFDARHQMVAQRVADVFDSRPASNLALLAGRFIALSTLAASVLLSTMAAIQAVGTLAQAVGWRIGEPVQPVSLVSFVVIDGLPAIALCCALVLLLCTALSSRVLILMIATGFLAAQYWLLFHTPVRLLPVISLMSGFGSFASDILPKFGESQVLAQRALLVAMAGGLLLAAASLGPQDNGSTVRRSYLVGTLALTMVAVLGFCVLVIESYEGTRLKAQWGAAHQAAATARRADLKHVEGRLRINPGRSLELDIELTLSAPSTTNSPRGLVFSFNPGMEVHELLVDGQPAERWHDAGLLRVDAQRSLPPDTDFTLAIRASGIPDPHFAYLDSAVDPLDESWADSLLPFLGTKPSVFNDTYVALIPGTRWLPMPGANLAADSALRRRDFFTIDLEINAPTGWHVAAPGRGTQTDSPNQLRFRPNAPLSEVTVVAAPFKRYVALVHGVEIELLLHPAHLRNVRAFASLKDALLESWQEFLEEASRFGIPYPYDGLSIVEVPAQLRVYGGGRSMASIQSNAGVLLMREHGFPTANFHMFPVPDVVPMQVQRQVVANYFLNDQTGGNLLVGAADNLLPLLTGGRGVNAEAAELLLTRLTSQLFRFRRSPFTAHAFTESAMSNTGGAPRAETYTSRPLVGLLAGVAARVAQTGDWDPDHPSLWHQATTSAWADLLGEHEPHHTLATKALKGNAIARVVTDSLGREDIGGMLAALRGRHSGSTLTMAHFNAIVSQVSPKLSTVIDGWLHSRSAPGFVTSPARIRTLSDEPELARYHVDVRVLNSEPVAGVVRLQLGNDAADGRRALRLELSETVVVPGNSSVQIGMLSAAPPLAVWLWTYLSHNRTDMRLPIVTEAQTKAEPPFVGVRTTSWRPPSEAGIIVDDLDEGFVIEPAASPSLVQLLGTAFAGKDRMVYYLDQGIPTYRTIARGHESRAATSRWFRQELGSAWGAYRRTIARIASGGSPRPATFAADIPIAGQWRLEYHLPDLAYQPRVKSFTQSPEVTGVWRGGLLGTHHLTLAAHGAESVIEFDAGRAVAGWNRVGTFELDTGHVRLHVSNRSPGETVIADAIRWRRVEPTMQSVGGPSGPLGADDKTEA